MEQERDAWPSQTLHKPAFNQNWTNYYQEGGRETEQGDAARGRELDSTYVIYVTPITFESYLVFSFLLSLLRWRTTKGKKELKYR